eukprot:Phypoly_transcript_17843.p1 GENE.Phypoly_transcript_17843~~Phypoly_transcript_17843.p1  ORF type:complete len:210 (+),score=27.62 Phypoly_transcript_17843:144-773(+)
MALHTIYTFLLLCLAFCACYSVTIDPSASYAEIQTCTGACDDGNTECDVVWQTHYLITGCIDAFDGSVMRACNDTGYYQANCSSTCEADCDNTTTSAIGQCIYNYDTYTNQITTCQTGTPTIPDDEVVLLKFQSLSDCSAGNTPTEILSYPADQCFVNPDRYYQYLSNRCVGGKPIQYICTDRECQNCTASDALNTQCDASASFYQCGL